MRDADGGGGLAGQLVVLARRLRKAGIAVGPGDTLLGLRAAAAVGVGDPGRLACALRCCWCHAHADLDLFDRVFATWWGRPPSAPPASGVPTDGGVRLHPAVGGEGGPRDDLPPRARREHRLEPSADPGLRAVDFGHCSPAELTELAGAVAALATCAPERPGRRRRRGPHGSRIDWPGSQRLALRSGGEWLRLVRARPSVRRRPLLVLCDTSGSMERYTRILLRFCHALQQGPGGVETFVFSTRLNRVTHQLRDRDPSRALAAVGGAAPGWAGGTRIGDALHELLIRWGPRVLSHGPVTLVISDGWETGSPERLAAALQRLRRSSWRLVWCNPLMGDPDFAPVTQGMRAALPHVDLLHPVHTLDSLEQLVGVVERARHRRPLAQASLSGSARSGRAGPEPVGPPPGR